MSRNKKEKGKISLRHCRKIRREDGLRLKTIESFTFRSLVEAVASRYRDRIAYSVCRAGEESDISFKTLRFNVRAASSYLLSLGYKKGDRVAVCGESSAQWMIMYFALTYIGLTAVPILPDFSEPEVLHIIEESGARGVCVNLKQYHKVSSLMAKEGFDIFRMNDLVHIPELSEHYAFDNAPGISLTQFKINDRALEQNMPCEDDIASIIFTSGTTGASKGVVLTQKNLLVCADEATDVYIHIKKGMKVLSILPVSHVYEFSITQILTLMMGCHIYFLGKAPATSALMAAFKEVHPSVILSVPLLMEKIYRKAVAPMLKDNPKIARLAKNPLTSPIVYGAVRRKLMATIGGKMKFFGLGGAPLDPEVEAFLNKANFPYAPGYGLTETSPLIACAGPKRRNIFNCWYGTVKHTRGYVGKVVSHVDLRIDNPNSEGVGEILVKGPNVMQGYYNRPDLNEQAFTEDGYFRTGDLGKLSSFGYLAIKGRCKTMILGPGGENIYPENIESLINNLEFVEESLVVPENGGLLALIKIDVEAMSQSLKISIEEARAQASDYIARIRKEVNSQLAVFSKISAAELQEEPFEKTPTQKIKRFLYPKKNK